MPASTPSTLVTVMAGNSRVTAAVWPLEVQSEPGRAPKKKRGCAGGERASRDSAGASDGGEACGAPREVRAWPVRSLPPAAEWHDLVDGATVLLAGVVPVAVETLEKTLPYAGAARILRFRQGVPCPLDIRPRPAARVGDDRLAAALGALSYGPLAPWIVLDAGTALTVNAVRPAGRPGQAGATARRGGVLGVFEGGWIAPGEMLALAALHRGTALLPDLASLPHTEDCPPLGRSTEEAIRGGVRVAFLAGTAGLVAAQVKLLGRRTRLAVTGGGAPTLWSALRTRCADLRPILVPSLVHHGLRLAFRHWQQGGA